MYIKNEKLAKIFNDEIIYNNKNAGLHLPYMKKYTGKGGLFYSDENISLIKDFVITLDASTMRVEEMNLILYEAETLLRKMDDLENFAIIIENSIGKPIPIDTHFLLFLNHGIDKLYIENVDLSHLNPNILERFHFLSRLNLNNNNISNMDLLREVNPNTYISLQDNNKVYEMDRDRLSQFVAERPYTFRSDNYCLNELTKAIRKNTCHLNSFVYNYKYLTHSNLKKLVVNILENPTSDIINRLKMISIDLRQHKNICFKGDFNFVKNIQSECNVSNNFYVNIDKVGDITDFYLARHKNIKGIFLKNEHSGYEQRQMYNISDFIQIKSRINKIIKDTLPLFKSKLTEKEIFTRIYFELAKQIEYDFGLLEEEKNNNYSNSVRCRNLVGGLLDNKCVCAGYADILKAVCSEVGIDADYIQGFCSYDDGHAWNRVKLDGKYYFTDLTWDRDDIVNNTFPLKYFLKSENDFDHKKYNQALSFDITKADCFESVSNDEQLELIKSKDKSLKDIFSDQITKITQFINSKSYDKDLWAIEPVVERLMKEDYNNYNNKTSDQTDLKKGNFYDYEKDSRDDY